MERDAEEVWEGLFKAHEVGYGNKDIGYIIPGVDCIEEEKYYGRLHIALMHLCIEIEEIET